MLRKRIKDVLKALFFAARAIGLPVLLLPLRWPRRFRPETVQRILVIRLDRLGDLALTLPLINALKRRWPSAEVTLLCREATAPLAEGHPTIDHVLTMPGTGQSAGRRATGWPSAEMVRLLRAGRFDLAIDPFSGEELGPALLAWESRARYRLGFSTAGRGGLFTRTVAADRRQSFIEQQRSLLAAIDVPLEVSPPWLTVSVEERRSAAERLRASGLDPGRPIIGIHPGGYYPTQRWPLGRFLELARQLEQADWQIAFFGTRAEERLIAQIGTGVGAKVGVYFGLELREFIAIMSHCRLFICNNSGPLHLAASLGLPTVSTMGPTNPVRWQPVGNHHRVVSKGLWCSPCQEAHCPLGTHDCLMEISVEEMAKAVRELTAALPGLAPTKLVGAAQAARERW